MILQEARKQVIEVGIRSVSARKIAREIGYSVGTLYNFFKDFDDLIMHLNAQTMNALLENLQRVDLANIETPEQRLEMLAHAYILYTRKNQNLWNCVFEFRLPDENKRPDWYREKIALLLSLIANIIEPLFGDHGDKAKMASAWVLWSSFHGICSIAYVERNDKIAIETAEEFTNNLILNYFQGIRSRAQK
nr:TetR/AcrR family transcriptional regulator [Sneathiella glossodoripedis]